MGEGGQQQHWKTWLQIVGVIISFFAIMVVLRWILNCFIDLAVLGNTESLMRQLSQLRRLICPWWHPRTQPQNEEAVGEEEAASSQTRERCMNDAMDRLLAGLTPSEKQELICSLLKIQVRTVR